jgi:hypothetical protein
MVFFSFLYSAICIANNSYWITERQEQAHRFEARTYQSSCLK